VFAIEEPKTVYMKVSLKSTYPSKTVYCDVYTELGWPGSAKVDKI